MDDNRLNIRQAVELAYREGFLVGYVRGFKKAKGKPTDSNRCPNNKCYLQRGHEGPHKPWPAPPKGITPWKG
jgi:hypothetical protein